MARRKSDAKLDRQSALDLMGMLPDRHTKDPGKVWRMIRASFGVEDRVEAHRVIAQAFGVSATIVRSWLRTAPLRGSRAKTVSSLDYANLTKTRQRGRHAHSIDKALDEGRHGRRSKVEPKILRRHFERIRNARDAGKVTWSRSRACRWIADRYGVHKKTVQNHVRDLDW